MTWNQFVLWMLIGYLLYYTINIIYDLISSANKQGGGDDDELYELKHEEKVETIDVQELLGIQGKKKDDNGTAKQKIQLDSEEQFVQRESTGGVTVRNLFSIYSGKAAVDTDSIVWD